ncbi:ORC1-type DNA replication protein [Methanocella arvoryzae]|uniref:ORC1-type DNA replication protein n=1 Tax=Methanocella arvoryzae (strain DSM 22066 / NBRC 105507 / MRE50) TaxID=351160 RepID=Q0W5B6_METAR|nr:cell division cycle protein 6 [Methanocella arvoryzae MRE50]
MNSAEDKSLDNIFQNLLSMKGIFQNREVLRSSYTPDYLPHRMDQINAVAEILVSALRGESPSNILIYGKTGTGKTATLESVSKKLMDLAEKMNVECRVLFINCERIDTQYRILAHLARHYNREVPITGWPTDQVFNEFRDALDKKEQVAIIILDEIDNLVKKSGDDILYNLSRINSDLKKAKVSIIGISNDLTFTDYLDPRVKSSLGEEEIIFPPYNALQLSDILEQRSKMAFKENTLEPSVIPLCSAFAAQEHGDARKALDLLRVSGEIAERSRDSVVKEEHVRRAREKIEQDRITEVVRTLPTQSKLVLYSIVLLDKGNDTHELNTGDVYNVYRRLCRMIDSDVLTQRRVTDLISELDMLGIVNATVVSKGRYGRTKEIALSVPAESTRKVLLDDYRLRSLKDSKPFYNQQRL